VHGPEFLPDGFVESRIFLPPAGGVSVVGAAQRIELAEPEGENLRGLVGGGKRLGHSEP
jgi:hypothetical protein